MKQATATVYGDGSAVLTIGGHRQKVRASDIQAARQEILKQVRSAAAADGDREDYALNVG